MNKIKLAVELSCVKIGGFSWNLWHRWIDPFCSIYCLFEVFIFNNVWNTVDNMSKCKNGGLKWKEYWPLVAILGLKSLIIYRVVFQYIFMDTCVDKFLLTLCVVFPLKATYYRLYDNTGQQNLTFFLSYELQ